MQTKIKIDYHCHPNFPLFLPIINLFLAKLKAKALWRAFVRHNLDVVVLAEHVYKHPKMSYELMERSRPANAKTVIFPAIEYLTREGVDMVVLAQEPQILYSHLVLLKPRALSTVELINFVKNHKDLFAIVVHPLMRSDTGIVFNHGADFAKNAIDVIERVEVHNCSFFLLMKLWSGLGLDKVCSRFFRSLKLVQNLPSSFFHAGCNITGGSDAHHVWDVGDYMEVVVENFSSIDRTALFEKVLNNKNDNFFINKNKPLYGFPVLVATVLRELFMKKATLYTIDNNEEREYLNCFSKAEKKSAKKFATLRTILFDPILFVLHKLRITPDTLTLSGLFLMLGFVYFLPINVFYAIACVLGHICLDGLDGALARYQQRSSDRGALLDIVVDQGVLVIGVLTAIYFNLISGFWGALYCTMYVVFITLIVVLNRMGQSIKYIFRSKYFFFVLLFVDLIKNTSMLIWFLPAVGIYMVAMCVYLLHRLRLELN